MRLGLRQLPIFVLTVICVAPTVLGWGGMVFFSSSARLALAILTFAMSGAALFAGLSARVGGRIAAIQPGPTSVTTGIYSVIRYPGCLGLTVDALGPSLALRSVAGVLLKALMMLPLTARIGAEEVLLHSQFCAGV